MSEPGTTRLEQGGDSGRLRADPPAGFILKHADELNVQPPTKPSLVAEAAKRARARRAQRPRV